MQTVGEEGRVAIHPNEHTHIAIVGVVGYGEGNLIGLTAANLGGKHGAHSGEVFVASEVVFTIAVVVDGDAKACGGGGVVLVLVVSHLDGEGVLCATFDEERRDFGIGGVVGT